MCDVVHIGDTICNGRCNSGMYRAFDVDKFEHFFPFMEVEVQ